MQYSTSNGTFTTYIYCFLRGYPSITIIQRCITHINVLPSVLFSKLTSLEANQPSAILKSKLTLLARHTS